MSEAQSVEQLMSKNAYANQPYVKTFTTAGTHRLPVITVTNNPAGSYPDPPSSDYILSMTTRGSGHAVLELGGKRIDGHQRRGAITLAAVETQTEHEVNFDFDLTVIGLRADLVGSVSDTLNLDAKSDLGPIHDQTHHDDFVAHAIQRAVAIANDACPSSDLAMDNLTFSLVHALLNRLTEKAAPQPELSQLSTQAFDLVRELIEDRLDDKIGLTELATLCNMDVFRFSRAFKARTGTTPHQFLIDARVTRARGLLKGTALTLADIAYACGFASQAHMTTTFSKHVGTTPGRYRNEVQG